ncbi:MAG: hypothetical protein U9R05_07635 [Chloroflexota bacterium]|nr:hypothetical protein [Chloroflexota bacterium]
MIWRHGANVFVVTQDQQVLIAADDVIHLSLRGTGHDRIILGVTGYGGGLDRKVTLLQLEGVLLRERD